jgi:alpha-glucosidase (family GH31 glycosyl hydrolase)
MADFGEHLPYDSKQIVLHSGEKAETYHNHYPEDWAQLNREVINESGKNDEALCFFRSGFTQSPGHMNLFWAGDQNVTWDQHYGIKSAVSLYKLKKKEPYS